MSRKSCDFSDELKALVHEIEGFSFKKFSPKYMTEKVLPRVEKLSNYNYEGETEKIEGHLKDIAQMGLKITALVAAGGIFPLFTTMWMVFPLILNIYRVIRDIHLIAKHACLQEEELTKGDDTDQKP